MISSLPTIKVHTDQKTKLRYFVPSDIDEEDIEDVVETRDRFKDVYALAQKLTAIDDRDFYRDFTNHYMICAENTNDARIAMFYLYNTIYTKLIDRCPPGEWIVEPESGSFALVSFGGSFGNGGEDLDEDFMEDFNDDANPTVKEIAPWGDIDLSKYLERKIVFVICISSDKSLCKEIAKDNGIIYTEVTKDSEEDLGEVIRAMLKGLGYDYSGIDSELTTLIGRLGAQNEYTVNTIFRMITSSHLLSCPNDKILRIEDIEPFLEIRKKPTEVCEKLTGDLVGLKDEREKLRGIIDMLRLETRRERFGYGRVSNGCNIVFAGPPGTAKTTLARQFAKALADMGLIEDEAAFKECKKSDIIGAYVGWTAKQVDMMFHSISKKGGGVIFFDEIYTLTDSKTDYDKEAITCITQNMENYRDSVFCIFAGYGDKMDEFLSANPGLRSRIQFNIKFSDYDNETLYEIFCSMASGNGFEIKGECRKMVIDFFARLKGSRGEQFGNGREARNLFTNAVQKMARRLGDKTDTTRDDLTTLTYEDIRLATEDILNSELGSTIKTTNKIGFAA